MIRIRAWMQPQGNYSNHKSNYHDHEYERAVLAYTGLFPWWDRVQMVLENDDGSDSVLLHFRINPNQITGPRP